MTASANKPVKIFQLAKQLNTSHRDIIEYLKSKDISASLNKALDPDTLDIVLNHFAEDAKKADTLIERREKKRHAEESRRLTRDEERKNEEAARRKVEEKVLERLKEKEVPQKSLKIKKNLPLPPKNLRPTLPVSIKKRLIKKRKKR
ncbi:MAG: translation initiation factor IF-2 N-terminal domain-containing protein [Candidatus Marinimicrobia bacterium]|nr:translation initiation factor IF-2 N-terminal domain-containing protein [Candidatus Neomarinimicrobiota bacterium]